MRFVSTGAFHPAQSQIQGKTKNLIEPARTGTARIAAGSTCAAIVAGEGSAFLTTAHGKAGNLLVQLLALTFGASGMLTVKDDTLEMVVALAANVFKNRHKQNLTTDDTDRH